MCGCQTKELRIEEENPEVGGELSCKAAGGDGQMVLAKLEKDEIERGGRDFCEGRSVWGLLASVIAACCRLGLDHDCFIADVDTEIEIGVTVMS
jgi:hypothetical protein